MRALRVCFRSWASVCRFHRGAHPSSAAPACNHPSLPSPLKCAHCTSLLPCSLQCNRAHNAEANWLHRAAVVNWAPNHTTSPHSPPTCRIQTVLCPQAQPTQSSRPPLGPLPALGGTVRACQPPAAAARARWGPATPFLPHVRGRLCGARLWHDIQPAFGRIAPIHRPSYAAKQATTGIFCVPPGGGSSSRPVAGACAPCPASPPGRT